MLARYLLLTLAILFFRDGLFAQEIKISVSGKPLNQVLIEIRDKYKVQLSFDDSELSKYKITATGQFSGIDNLLAHLLSKLPLEYEKISGIYVISPKRTAIAEKTEKPKIHHISGRIIEYGSGELLPYTQLQINSFSTLCDQNGFFSYSSASDSVFKIKVMHLGYFVKDTILYRSRGDINIYLTPSDQFISEITVNENLFKNFYQVGNEPATIKLNHKISSYLPGSSDNSVFNLLRLQPGILAAGEQSEDVLIWGSYAGQSRTFFDGITIFGLKNFNDNISTINPLLTKNIQVKKAAYDAGWGDCVGGIVDISGKEGNTRNLKLNTGINNFTINGLLEIPVMQKSSLQLAYRQTYYNLYKNGLNLFPRTEAENLPIVADIPIFPDYGFRDFNIKYSLKTKHNLFYINFLNGKDQFNYFISQNRQYRNIDKTTREENVRQGIAVFYDFRINHKTNSVITLSKSSLASNMNNQFEVKSTLTGRLVNEKEILNTNNIAESKALLRTTHRGNKNNVFEIDLQVVNNNTLFKEDSSVINTVYNKKARTYYTLALKEIISMNNIKLNVGARVSYLPYLQRSFFEPRVSFSHTINQKSTYHLAWGRYQQFLVKTAKVDQYGNYNYFWAIAGEESVPVTQSEHWVAGFSFNADKIWFNLDAFYKTTDGISRYFRTLQPVSQGVYEGNSKNYGFDLYSKYNFGRHTIWLSYTLSESLEHFSYFRDGKYRYAPQDQKHEIKAATLIDLKPFYLSADYVYGSGFLENPYLQDNNQQRIPYSRLDIAVTFKFIRKKITGECGISVLNVLNTENRKFSTFERIPVSRTNSVSLYFEAVPFTPTIFLKLSI
jgi:hypothetical protein